MWDLVGNPNCWFSHAEAHFIFNPGSVKLLDDWIALQLLAVAAGASAIAGVIALVTYARPGNEKDLCHAGIVSDHVSSKMAHELFEKINNQDGVQDGWHKQENSIPELYIFNVLCLKCSFCVLINKNTII